MNEKTLKNLFEKHLTRENIQHEREYRTDTHTVDFKIKFGNKFCGVEARSSKGSVFNTIGQLLVTKKTFSHTYLLSTEEFLKKIQDVVGGLGIGTIILKDGEFITTRHPGADYYFRQPESYVSGYQKKKADNMIVGDKDSEILNGFGGRTFSCLDVMKRLGATRADAYARIGRLVRAGLVVEESSFNPKTYSVRKVVGKCIKLKLP